MSSTQCSIAMDQIFYCTGSVSAAQFKVTSYNNEDGVLVVQKQMRRSTIALGKKKAVHVLSNEESIYGSSVVFDLSNPQL